MRQQANQRPLWHTWHLPQRIALLFLIALVALLVTPPQTSHASGPHQPLINGSFEGGFVDQPVCRWRSEYETTVGAGWRCFHNFGAARYGFYADEWASVVADGQVSQLIEINTWGLESGDNDRYAGIYQTVHTIPGAAYQLSMRGMIRTTNMEGDEWRYRVEVGYLDGKKAGTDWRRVQNWTDVEWNTYYPRTEPGSFSDYQAIVRPNTNQVTIFIRVWKKWGLTNEEIDVNLDAISFVLVDPPKKEKKY